MSANAPARPVQPGRALRILHVVPTYYPAVRYGGPIRSVHGLAKSLVRLGHDVHVYTSNLDHDRNLDVPLGRPVDLDGVKISYFPVPMLRRLCWSPAMAQALAADVSGFDLVHLHSTFLWPTMAAARAARRARVPYVLSPRGMLVRDLIERKSPLAKKTWIWLFERRTLAAARVVHVTAPIEESELRALGLPLPRVVEIPNGIEWPENPPPRSAGPYADLSAPYALYLSRISWKKGLDILIDSLPAVRELHLIVAGNDEENYTPMLRDLAQKLGVAGRVHFVGAASDEHKWSLIEDATVFVLPSRNENFGNAVAEAMAMRCPVVVTPGVGIAELVRSANAGRVVNANARELASTINGLTADPTERRRLGAAGHAAVVRHLSWGHVARRFEEVYFDALAERARVTAPTEAIT